MPDVRHDWPQEFESYERLVDISDRLAQTSARKLVVDPRRPATLAVVTLWTKARKTARAIYLLASGGYGQDSMVLARGLANLCIDLGYICFKDPDHRARWWWDHGRLARRAWTKQLGQTPPDENTVDWGRVTDLAARWKQVTIRDRALSSGRRSLYDIFYRLGSSFEHSDAWSGLTFLEFDGKHVRSDAGPSSGMIGVALLLGGMALADTVITGANFFRVNVAKSSREFDAIVEPWLRRISAMGAQANER